MHPHPAPAEEEQPEDATADAEENGGSAPRKPPRHENPTRYGDWEIGGRCVDF